jgi:hypothetical protein
MPGNSTLEDEIELLLARDADVPPATARRLAQLFVRGNDRGEKIGNGGGGTNNISTVAVNLTSMPGYDGALDGLETTQGLGFTQITATGAVSGVPVDFAGFVMQSGTATSVEFFDHASAASGQLLMKIDAPAAGVQYPMPGVETTLLGLYCRITGGASPVLNAVRGNP